MRFESADIEIWMELGSPKLHEGAYIELPHDEDMENIEELINKLLYEDYED